MSVTRAGGTGKMADQTPRRKPEMTRPESNPRPQTNLATVIGLMTRHHRIPN